MAVDTREKRFAMMNFAWVPYHNLFEADGTVDADDRAHLLHLYGGIALANPTAGGSFPLVNGPLIKSLFRGLVNT